MTSLFLACYSNDAADTYDAKGKKIKRWYYIDIKQTLSTLQLGEDIETAIFSVPEGKKRISLQGQIIEDYSTDEMEYRQGMFPFNKIFNSSDWRRAYSKYWNHSDEKTYEFDLFEEQIIKRFEQYQLPIIELHRETPKEAVCQVFEKVNTGGVSLTVFELLTATFAADNYSLRDDWIARDKNLKAKHNVLLHVSSTDFLQAIALVTTYHKENIAVGCKRKDILNLTVQEYQSYADVVTRGFEEAAKLFWDQKIFHARDLPYQTQLIPLAATFAVLENEIKNDTARNKLIRWLWCGIFGELYSSSVETRFSKDLPELIDWLINDSKEPSTISEANFLASRLYSLKTRTSAAYKGIYALLLRGGGYDFFSGEPIDAQVYFDQNVDIHHIFPRQWCIKNDIQSNIYNCIVNKTPLSARTNRKIGGNAPKVYLERIQKELKMHNDRINEILDSHLIDPTSLRTNNFESFFNSRANALLNQIEIVMGKKVHRGASEDKYIDEGDE